MYRNLLMCSFWSILALTARSTAADWPQLFGPERSGVSTETGLSQAWPKTGPALVWEHPIGPGYSGPVVAEGRVIAFYRRKDQEIVECLDAAKGKELWKYSYATNYHDRYGKGDGPRSTPLIAGKYVFTLGADGTLHCLGLEDGKKLWSREINMEYRVREGYFGVATSPILEGDRLLINVGGKGAGVVAFDRDTGKEAWKSTDQQASYSSPVLATIDGVRHALFFTREGILSLDPKTGAVRFSKRWRARIDASVNAAVPLVLDGHVLISASYQTGAALLKVKKDQTEEVWKSDEVLSCHYSSSVRSGDYVFGFDGRQEEGARLRCIDWKAGKVMWTKEGFGCGSIIQADGNLIILGESGELVLVEATAKGYREKARVAILKPTRAPIALANGKLFARDNGRMICLELKK